MGRQVFLSVTWLVIEKTCNNADRKSEADCTNGRYVCQAFSHCFFKTLRQATHATLDAAKAVLNRMTLSRRERKGCTRLALHCSSPGAWLWCRLPLKG